MSSATWEDILARFRNIVTGEGRGEREFTVWAHQSSDPELKKALELVRDREREHADAFAIYLAEIGESAESPVTEHHKEFWATVTSKDRTDREKLEWLYPPEYQLNKADNPLLESPALTGRAKELLVWYRQREDDTSVRLRAELARIRGGS
jgi:hypothetical protein